MVRRYDWKNAKNHPKHEGIGKVSTALRQIKHHCSEHGGNYPVIGVEPVVGASLRGAFRKFFLRLGHFCET